MWENIFIRLGTKSYNMDWRILLVLAILSTGWIGDSPIPFIGEKTTTTIPPSTTSSTTSSTTTSTTLAPLLEFMVHLEDFQAKPAAATITQYNGVTWKNLDPVDHKIAFEDGVSGLIRPGATYTRVFNDTGTYRYSCSIHKRFMQGVVTVK